MQGALPASSLVAAGADVNARTSDEHTRFRGMSTRPSKLGAD
jgi:hypothetical protein